MEEIAETVRQSSKGGYNIPQLIEDPRHPVVFNDLMSYLKSIFRPLPSLKKYHHFRMSSMFPGTVFVIEYASSEEEHINLLRSGKTIGGFPDEIHIPSRDLKRQWYLYEEVSPLCMNTKPKCAYKVKCDTSVSE